MTPHSMMKKWFSYGLCLFVVWVLDACILSRYPMYGVTPTLLPLTVVAVAVQEGPVAGSAFGIGVGLLWETTYPGGFGGLIFGMALAGMMAGIVAQYALRQSFAGCLISSGGVLAALGLLRVLRGLLSHSAPLGTLLHVAVPECLLSLAWMPLIYVLFRWAFHGAGNARTA